MLIILYKFHVKRKKENLIKFLILSKQTFLPPKVDPKPKPEETVLCFPKSNFHGIYNDINSIIDALGSIGYPSDNPYREKIGIRNKIPGIPFKGPYNIYMLNLIKAGKLIIP